MQKVPLGYRMMLFTSVPFGLAMGLFFAAKGDVTAALVAGAVAGVGYGALMTLIFGLGQVLTTSRGGERGSVLGVRQKRTFPVLGHRDDVLRELRVAFEVLGVRRFDLDSAEAGVLTGHTGMSFQSFGENLGAVVEGRGEACEVTVTSEPRLPTTLADFGRNLRNVELVEQRLLEHVPVPEAQAAPEARRATERARRTAQTAR